MCFSNQVSPEITTSKTHFRFQFRPKLIYNWNKVFDFGSQHLEIFSLPAVPTEHLDGHRQPHFPMSLHSVFATLKLGITDKIISSFNAKLSQLSKTVQDLKIGHILARPTTQKRTLSCVLILFSIWCYKIRTGPPYYLAPLCIRPIRFLISTDSTDIKWYQNLESNLEILNPT